MEDVVILGTGAAGLTAAIYTGRAMLNPVVIEGMQPGGQLTTTSEVENYPGFEEGIDGPSLMDIMHKQAERFGTRFVYDQVISTDFSVKPYKLTLEGGDVLEAKTVIIATGATAKYLGLESEQALMNLGVSACATCDGALFKGEALAVVGGGDTAMEEALFLTRFASKVTVIHRRNEFRASKIMTERVLKHEKIEVVWDSVVEEINNVEAKKVTGVRVRNVKTNEEQVLPVGGVFMAIGHKPNTDPFGDQLDKDDFGYLVTKGVHTNIEGVFAAGDVQDRVYRQAITAAGTGCMAGLEAERYLEALEG